MPDIKIKGWSGSEFSYQGVPKVWLPAPESTEDAPVLVPYTYGEAVSKNVEPDFSGGDMEVPIADGELVAGMTITKPETLVPENIAAGVNVAGIIGTFAGGSGVLISSGTYTPNTTGRITIPHGLGAVPDFVIVCSHASTGFVYQYSMSEAFFTHSGAPYYGMAVFGSVSSDLPECYLTTDKGSLVGAIGNANADTFQVGGVVYRHEKDATYTWIALAMK